MTTHTANIARSASQKNTERPAVLRLLLVDDDESYRAGVAESLTAQGFEVRQASNGEEALKAYYANPGVDIILTDLFMPRMDGIELIEYFHGHPRIRVIALSCPSPEGFRLDGAARAVGAWEVVDKKEAGQLPELLLSLELPR